MSRQLVVLCGGKGTRIAAVTGGVRQKCLLPVAGRPFLSYVLGAAEAWRVDEVLLLAGHHGSEVAAFAAGLGRRRYRLDCHVEHRPLGTVGAIRAVADRLEPAFLVALGDVHPPPDLDLWERMAAVLERTRAAAVLASAAEQESMDQGNLVVHGDLVVRYDKSAPAPLIDRGVRLFTRDGLGSATGDSDTEYFGALVAARRLAHCPIPGQVLDIGTPERLHRAHCTLNAAGTGGRPEGKDAATP